MQRVLLIVASALALAVAGCGSDDDGGSTSTAAPGAPAAASGDGGAKGGGGGGGETVTVDMVSIQFAPKDVEVAVGDTVRWVNQDTVDHDAVSTSGDEFESEVFGKGGTYEWTADAPGTVEYECTLHPGMVGTITVR